MSRISMILVVALGVLGLVAVVAGAAHLVITQMRAAAPSAVSLSCFCIRGRTEEGGPSPRYRS